MNVTSNKKILSDFKTLKKVSIEGWVKSNRDNGNFGFIVFNDGSSCRNIQLVYKKEITNGFDELKRASTGSAIYAEGEILLTPNSKQPFEILLSKCLVLKQAEDSYPLQKKRHTVEYLREIAHLRQSTNLLGNVMRVRSKLFKLLNDYFFENDFIWVTTPVLTSNDAEGAGESFYLAKVDNKEFFNIKTTLSVTGQLHGEAYALTFKKIFTFGPQFRAEKSHTSRHAAEFWMLEPEISFLDINGLMDLMEDMLKKVTSKYIKWCEEEINFFNEFVDKDIRQRLNKIVKEKFEKISYGDAINILIDAKKEKKITFENNNIKWGMDLESEHERYICEQHFNRPTFIFNYPSVLKAFYMKENDDGKTVAGVDLLVPGVGELCGGSEREANYQTIYKKASNTNINIEELQWYLDLRKYGYYKSSGFGLGFERLIMFLTGVNNIRDTIPFPRTHGNIKF